MLKYKYCLFFSYLIEGEVCYLILAERGFSKKSSFTFLEELAAEFNLQYGRKVAQVTRPYSFIEFGMLFFFYYKKL